MLRPWSQDDDQLRELYEIGMPMVDIGARIGRSRGAVKLRVFNTKLSRQPARFAEYIPYIALPNEQWARVRWASLYFASDLGRVLSMAKGAHMLAAGLDDDGYPRVELHGDGAGRHICVHRLVAQHHVEGEAPGLEVAHWDGDRANPRASNLRWATCVENKADMHRHGTAFVGERHPRATITEAQAVEAKRLLSAGKTAPQAASEIGASCGVVRKIKSGRTWRHLQVRTA